MFQSYALFPHMTVRANISYGLEMERLPAAEIRARVDEILATTELVRLRRPQAGAIVRRPEAARRAGPGAGQAAAPAAARRAARRARQEAARRHADGAEAPAARGRHHLRHRHPRPGRSAGHGRPHGGAEGRPAAAMRHAARDLRASGRPLRRRLHRRDEFLSRAAPPPMACCAATARGSPARCRDGLSPGAAAVAAVRPERIRLFPSAEIANRIAGTVEALAYHGLDLQLHVRTALSPKPFLVRVTADAADRRPVASATRSRSAGTPPMSAFSQTD